MTNLAVRILIILTVTFSTLFIPTWVSAEEIEIEQVVPNLISVTELPTLSPAPPEWTPPNKSKSSATFATSATSATNFHVKAPSIWVSGMNGTSVTLDWTSGAQMYDLQIWVESSNTWESIYRGDRTSFTHMNIPKDTFTFIRVAGWDGAWSPWCFQNGYLATFNFSSYSGEQNLVKVDSMSGRNVLTTTGGSNYAYLKWINNDWEPVYANEDPVFTDTDVKANQEYYYAMFAKDNGDWHALNGYGFIRVNTPPAKPENFQSTSSPLGTKLTWSPVSGEPLEDTKITYHIYLNDEEIAKTTETSYTIADLKENTPFTAGVFAENSLFAKSDVSTMNPFDMKTYKYVYDDHNHLIEVLENDVSLITFEYDDNGNLKRKIVQQKFQLR